MKAARNVVGGAGTIRELFEFVWARKLWWIVPFVVTLLLVAIVGDPGVTITTLAPLRPSPPSPPLDPKVINPAAKLVARYFPGVPLVPVMANGYTDATFLGAVGIPTFGVPGGWEDPDGNGVHGLNERIEARSLYIGRDFLFDLIKAYAG